MGAQNKIKLRWLVLAGIAAVMAGIVQKADATLVNSNSIVQDGIEYYIQTDKSTYLLGEEVQILYRLTNLNDYTWSVPCYIPDITVGVKQSGPSGLPVWAADPYRYPVMGVYLILQAGATRQESYCWDMPDYFVYDPQTPAYYWQSVEQGSYDVIGETTGPTPEVSVTIDVIPEPGTLCLLAFGFIGIIMGWEKGHRQG